MPKKVCNIFKQSDFKYVVANTGYTGRLVYTFGFVHYEKSNNGYIASNKIDEKFTKHEYSNVYNFDICETCGKYDDKKPCECPPPAGILFIYDTDCGNGLYTQFALLISLCSID